MKRKKTIIEEIQILKDMYNYLQESLKHQYTRDTRDALLIGTIKWRLHSIKQEIILLRTKQLIKN